MRSKTRTLIWVCGHYLVIAISAAAQPFLYSNDSSAIYLAQLAATISPGFWMIHDAKSRGIFIPHITQPFLLSWWYIAAPLYLLATRRWWGLFYILTHVLLTYGLTVMIFDITVYAVWGTAQP